MADVSGKTIKQLNTDTQITGEELVPVFDTDNTTKSVSLQTIMNSLQTASEAETKETATDAYNTSKENTESIATIKDQITEIIDTNNWEDYK